MRLTLEHFGNHDFTELVLPDRGIAVFTGENGAGKSMIGEALTWCLWGITLRSYRSGWSPTIPGSIVSVELAGTVYERTSTDRGTRFSISDTDSTRDNNRTIIEQFGTFKMYTATRIFHRALLSKFSTATDGERKALMESMLGVSVFDECLQNARDERRMTIDELLECETRLSKASFAVAYVMGSLESMAPPVRPVKTEEVIAASDVLLSTNNNTPSKCALWNARSESTSLCAEQYAARKEYKRIKHLVDLGKCSMCGSDIGEKHESALRHAHNLMEEVGTRCDAALERTNTENEAYSRAVKAYDREQAITSRAASIVLVYDNAMNTYLQRNYNFEGKITSLKNDLMQSANKLNKIRVERLGLRARKDRLDDLIKIYGSKGARVLMLSRAFSTLSKVSTKVMSSIYGRHVPVIVRASERLDKVSFDVQIVQKNTPYRGLSEGEKSLVDFALLKALSSVSMEGSKCAPLPLIYDDILHAIDENKRELLARFIKNEALDNGVLLFTHDTSVKNLFSNASFYKVEDGCVRRV